MFERAGCVPSSNDFPPIYNDFSRGSDAQSNSASLSSDHLNGDRTSNHNFLSDLATQN